MGAARLSLGYTVVNLSRMYSTPIAKVNRPITLVNSLSPTSTPLERHVAQHSGLA